MPGLNYGVEVSETFITRDAISQGVFTFFAIELGIRLLSPHIPVHAVPAQLALLTMVLSILGGLHDYKMKHRGFGTWVALFSIVALLVSLILWHLQFPWLSNALLTFGVLVEAMTLGAGFAIWAVHGFRFITRRGDGMQWFFLGFWLMVGHLVLAYGFEEIWVTSLEHLNQPMMRLYAFIVAWGSVVLFVLDGHNPNMEVSK